MLTQSAPANLSRRSTAALNNVTVPILISGIVNVLAGLFYFATCYGIVLAIPMIVLCVFEFVFVSNAPRMHPREVASKAQTLAVFEIIVGLFNIASLVCGIIVLANASNLTRNRP